MQRNSLPHLCKVHYHHSVLFFFPWLYYLQPLLSLPSSCCFVLLSMALLPTAITIITIIMLFRSAFQVFTTYSHYYHYHHHAVSFFFPWLYYLQPLHACYYHTYLPGFFTFFDDDNFWFAAVLPLPDELLPGVPQPLPLPYEPVHGGEALRPLLRVQPGVVSCAVKN
jgi:hypothetical protein